MLPYFKLLLQNFSSSGNIGKQNLLFYQISPCCTSGRTYYRPYIAFKVYTGIKNVNLNMFVKKNKHRRECKDDNNMEVTHQLIQFNSQWIHLFAGSVESVRKM